MLYFMGFIFLLSFKMDGLKKEVGGYKEDWVPCQGYFWQTVNYIRKWLHTVTREIGG
jgi:hypothetical protein